MAPTSAAATARLASRLANAYRRAVFGDPIIDTGCSLKAFRAPLLKQLQYWDGMHRFLPTLVRMQGFRVIEMPVHHRPRVAGKAKYGLFNRLIKPFADTLAVRWMQNRRIRTDCEELGR